MRPWYLGNTTVRSPFRLRDGLVVLSKSSLQGNLRGQEQEIALRRLLGEHGIVELGDDDTYSVGRKWRSALNKLFTQKCRPLLVFRKAKSAHST